jgi:hypothetical protein
MQKAPNEDSLSLARRQYATLDNMGRAGVKIRTYHAMTTMPELDADSSFIYAVAAEMRQDPLP